jgi:hypothetical protein
MEQIGHKRHRIDDTPETFICRHCPQLSFTTRSEKDYHTRISHQVTITIKTGINDGKISATFFFLLYSFIIISYRLLSPSDFSK